MHIWSKLISAMASSFFFFSMVLLPICVVAQTRSNITIGDSLVAESSNSSWVVSPLGDFAFGFLQLNDSENELFLLSIWYAKIPEKTIVWYANGDSPAPKGSKVELSASDGVVLTAPNGDQLWKTVNLTGKVASGFLNDTGNFVLKGGGGNGNFDIVWESFKDPRDTLLPTQILERGGKLCSRFLESNFSEGRFELLLQSDGILSLHAINKPSEYVNENYYESYTGESDMSSPGIKLVFERSGYMYVLRKNNEKYNLSSSNEVSTKESYLRATLTFDGVFTFYQHPKSSIGGSDGWSPLWSLPDNICLTRLSSEGSGICGFNSICSLRDDKRPNCLCPKGYSLVDPNDPFGSCKPDFVQGCAEDDLIKRKDYDFEALINTDWPGSNSDYLLLKPFSEEQCKQSCLEDCLCAGISFQKGDSCMKKKFPLSNGRVDPGLNGAKTYMKVRKDNSSLFNPPLPVNMNKNRNTLILVVSVLFGTSAFLNLLFIGAMCMGFSFIFQYKKKLGRGDNIAETNLLHFSYKELEKATNGFNKELGRGSFGVVYEGVINIGSSVTTVAVKKLNNILQQVEKEFKNELYVIGLTHHKNLVRLIGYCEAASERLLVYEYMSNGTLATFLFNGEKPSWKLRLETAFGIARGLAYLHEECSTQIIHCDIKPQNILLDDYNNARISDFGLAKLLKVNQSRTNTAIRGTKGYVAVEWFKNMPITAKVDVFSYGVLLLEIICCRRNVEMKAEEEERAILTDWACDCYMAGDLDALVKDDMEALEDIRNLEKFVMIAIWCVQENPELRPTMRKVTQMIEGAVEVQAPPYPSPISIS